MSQRDRKPSEIVVMSRETPVPTLRAHLRQQGMRIPPALARQDWGPALIRAGFDEEIPAASSNSYLPPAPRQPHPVSSAPRALRAEPQHSEPDYFDSDYSEPNYSDSDYNEPQPVFGDSPQTNPYSEPIPAESWEQPTGAFSPIQRRSAAPPMEDDPTPGGPSPAIPAPKSPPSMEQQPATMQLNYQHAAALADQFSAVAPNPGMGVGESTTQASHRIERLDLSDWGYLLRIVMIAEQNDPGPRTSLESLSPTIGQWLQDNIDQPARLEYDRRFRRDLEKRLAKFMTQTLGRFPVIKADVQFIE